MKPRKIDVRCLELDQETMVHDTDRRQVYVLNTTASSIWSLCDGEHSMEQIAEELGKRFRTTSAEAIADVRRTVELFGRYGLLDEA